MDEFKKNISSNLPNEVKGRLSKTFDEIDEIFKNALACQTSKIKGKISFKYEHSAPTDIMTPFERAQSVCFIIKYENLPTLNDIEIVEYKGKFYLKNIDFIRHIINEYRPIIFNQNDSIFYTRIHNFCYSRVMNRDPSKGLSISVEHEAGQDVTKKFAEVLGERNKSVKLILNNCEFDYLYNGILQHSDERYTNRFWKEYSDGRCNHIFLKHAYLLRHIQECLYWHYTILNQLTFPKMGAI